MSEDSGLFATGGLLTGKIIPWAQGGREYMLPKPHDVLQDEVLRHLTAVLLQDDETVILYTPRWNRLRHSTLWAYLVGLPGAQLSGDKTWIQYMTGARLIVITDDTKSHDVQGIVIRAVYIAGTYEEWIHSEVESTVANRLVRTGSDRSPYYFMNFWDPESIPEAMVRADFIQTSKRTPQHRLQDVINSLTDMGAHVELTYIIDHIDVHVTWPLKHLGHEQIVHSCNRLQLETRVDLLSEDAGRLAAYVNKDSKGTT